MGELIRRGQSWLDERVPVAELREVLLRKTVPIHRLSVFYYFGGMTLFFFVVQIVTGILLMLYYRPSADEAFESVEFIMTTVPFGWLIRSIHSWSANLMVFFAFLHLTTAFFMKAYRPPREITWITGALLLFLSLGFGFSGYLLPWNELAFFATKVGTDIAGAVPLVGELLLRFLRGGDHVSGGTLSRFYGWHVAILPALTFSLLGLHLLLIQLQGISVPPGREDEAKRRRAMPFFPHFALRELFGWTLALAVLATLAAVFPWELGEKADPFAPAPKDIRPEWYFMFMFQTLKLVPGGEIMGLEYEAVPILIFGLAGLVLLLMPFIDRGVVKRGRSPVFTAAGVFGVIFVVAMTSWGYHSWLPVLVVLLSGVLVFVLGLGTRASAAVLLAAGLFALTPGNVSAQASPEETSCVGCHGSVDLLGEPLASIPSEFAGDVHAEVGLGCHDCHGGNPDATLSDDMEAAMDPRFRPNPYRGVPERRAIPSFCGECHSDPGYMKRYRPDARVDQEREYWTSRHGLALRTGDTRVATCVDCHGIHGILRPSDPDSGVYPTRVAETCRVCHADAVRMAGYKTTDGQDVPVDQYERWRRSVHAAAMFEKEDLSAPTCNDCHGNHGATPPGLETIAFVCGQCHGREATLFRQSPKEAGFRNHNEAFLSEMGPGGCADCHETSEPQAAVERVRSFSECATCHGNHAVVRPTAAMLGPLPETPCAFCHEGPVGAAMPDGEPTDATRRYEEARESLLASASELGLQGDERFDWLVDQAERLPSHTQEGITETGEPELRPEFRRLFRKFRIGKTHFAFTDPLTGAEVKESVIRCTGCHAEEPDLAESAAGFEVSRDLLNRMHELTSLTARAERVLLRAQRGGVAVREAQQALDQAVDAQVELEVLVHAFSTAEDSAFAETYRGGIEQARSALAAGRDGLHELRYRRRGLGASLVIIVVVLVALGIKIRGLSWEGSDSAG